MTAPAMPSEPANRNAGRYESNQPRLSARAPGGERGADLVGGEHPAEHDAGALAAERLAAERDGGRHGRHPVEAVEDDEHDQRRAPASEQRGVQDEQRQAAQAVVPEQQPARVEAVGQPARGGRADDVEDADRGEQPGAGRPSTCRGRGRPRSSACRSGRWCRAADEEGAREQPEVALARRLPEHVDGVPERVARRPRRRRRRARSVRRRARGRLARAGRAGTRPRAAATTNSAASATSAAAVRQP